MITVAELRAVPLFAALPDDQAGALAARLGDVRLREGDWLIHEGEQPSFYMVVEGSLEMRKVVHGIERRLDEYGVGTYFGELRLLPGAPAVANIRAQTPRRGGLTTQASRNAGT